MKLPGARQSASPVNISTLRRAVVLFTKNVYFHRFFFTNYGEVGSTNSVGMGAEIVNACGEIHGLLVGLLTTFF